MYFSAEFDASNLASRFIIELAAELRSSMVSSSAISSPIKPGAQPRTTLNRKQRDRYRFRSRMNILRIRSWSPKVIRLLQQLTPHRRMYPQDIFELLEHKEFAPLSVFPATIISSILMKQFELYFLTLRMLNVYLSVRSAA